MKALVIKAMKQGDREVNTYYNEMLTLWQELDQCYDIERVSPNDCALFMKHEETDRGYMFLASVNKSTNEVKGKILRHKSLPSIHEVLSKIRQEESRKRIMMRCHA